jgi:hypothetical protein
VARVIAYVDGFNLYHGLRERFRHRYLWLDLHRLVQRLRPGDTIVAVRYFTAAVRNDPPALARQQSASRIISSTGSTAGPTSLPPDLLRGQRLHPRAA